MLSVSCQIPVESARTRALLPTARMVSVMVAEVMRSPSAELVRSAAAVAESIASSVTFPRARPQTRCPLFRPSSLAHSYMPSPIGCRAYSRTLLAATDTQSHRVVACRPSGHSLTPAKCRTKALLPSGGAAWQSLEFCASALASWSSWFFCGYTPCWQSLIVWLLHVIECLEVSFEPDHRVTRVSFIARAQVFLGAFHFSRPVRE